MEKNQLLQAIADSHGTPCYVYFADEAYERINAIRKRFEGRFEISYAVKSNPNPALLDRFRQRVEMLDISSVGELRRALSVKWAADKISFTGPGKRPDELRAAVEHGVGEVIVESVAEACRLDGIVSEAKTRQRILVRISPSKLPRGFGVSMGGKPCQFGIDEEDARPALERILALKNLDLCGLHIYSGTQCLDTESIVENYGIFVDLFRRLSEDHDMVPEKLVFGSGLGIPYHDGNRPVDLPAIAERVNPMLAQLRREPRFADTRLILETGRYIVGEAGIYLTRVLCKKTSRGAEIRICDGGMNHNLGACGHLGSVIHRNYQMFKLGASSPEAEERPYDLVGPLCTSIDTLGHRVKFAGLDVGDVIAIQCSGAYGVTASPVYFISHDPPRELLVETRNGKTAIEDVTQILPAV